MSKTAEQFRKENLPTARDNVWWQSLIDAKTKEREEKQKILIENYTLGLLTEECGEISQAAGKCIRFGIDTPGPKSLTGREMLNLECGDILAAIEYGIQKGVLDKEKIQKYMVDKLEKLLNPNSVDNLGRRLAP